MFQQDDFIPNSCFSANKAFLSMLNQYIQLMIENKVKKTHKRLTDRFLNRNTHTHTQTIGKIIEVEMN